MSTLLHKLLLDIGLVAEHLDISVRAVHETRKNDPTFPKPIALGPRCLRWRMRDIEAWVNALPVHEERAEPTHLRLARDARLSRRRGEEAAS